MYYTNDKGDIAKVLGVDECTGLATVVINDKAAQSKAKVKEITDGKQK